MILEPNESVTNLEHERLLRHGLNKVLVRFGDTLSEDVNARALAFYDFLGSNAPEWLIEAAPTIVSVVVEFDGRVSFQQIESDLNQLLLAHKTAQFKTGARMWQIPACFAYEYAPQLVEVADIMGLSPQAVIDSLCSTKLKVLTIGFAPGQPYIGLLPEAWNFPRMTELTPKVPRGALAASLRQLVLFQNASATGWRHIGQTKFTCFEPERDQAFGLQAGDHIRFTAVSRLEYDALSSTPESFGGARLEVIS